MTDIKIKNGDIITDSSGNFVRISGAQAKLQRALICVKARRGEFIYDRSLGRCDNDYTGENAESELELALKEAIIDCPDTQVRVLKITDGTAEIELVSDGVSRKEEIEIG